MKHERIACLDVGTVLRLHIHIARLQIFRNPNASRLDVVAHLSS